MKVTICGAGRIGDSKNVRFKHRPRKTVPSGSLWMAPNSRRCWIASMRPNVSFAAGLSGHPAGDGQRTDASRRALRLDRRDASWENKAFDRRWSGWCDCPRSGAEMPAMPKTRRHAVESRLSTDLTSEKPFGPGAYKLQRPNQGRCCEQIAPTQALRTACA